MLYKLRKLHENKQHKKAYDQITDPVGDYFQVFCALIYTLLCHCQFKFKKVFLNTAKISFFLNKPRE